MPDLFQFAGDSGNRVDPSHYIILSLNQLTQWSSGKNFCTKNKWEDNPHYVAQAVCNIFSTVGHLDDTPILPMSTSTALINIASEDVVQRLLDTLTQIEPFWEGVETERPTQPVRTYDFEEHWMMILKPEGSYGDELGRREAIRRKIDDDNDANDVHWAAHNAAKLWFTMSGTMPLVGRDKKDTPHSIVWRKQVRAMRSSCREGIRELALQEMTRMRAQADTRTTVITSSNPYPYPGLLADPSAIPLVVLLPAKEKHSDIFCVLCNSTLSRSESNQYKALSYVWSTSSKRKSITVNGQPFQATENLESALRNLRYRDKRWVLWIDSMCINQNDVTERNKQVQQMGCIYSKAQMVVVWLGPESDTSSNAFQFFQHGSVRFRGPKDSQDHEKYRDAVISSVEALHHFAKRTWFTRIWCVQEFILGQRVTFQCGQHTGPWECFKSTLEIIAAQSIRTAPCLEYINTIGNQGLAFKEKFVYSFSSLVQLFSWKGNPSGAFESVLSLLSAFREWASSDPRDRIFTFYGLVPLQNSARDFLKPDYSLNTSEVHIRFAVQYLQAHRELDILSVATHPVNDLLNISRAQLLPCWVPDWRDNHHFGAEFQYRTISFFFGIGTSIYSFDKLYNATLGLKATSLNFEDNSRILSLDGIEVDTIQDIGALCRGRVHSYAVACNVLSEWKEIAGLSTECNYRHTSQPLREAFWRTLLMDDNLHTSAGSDEQRSRISPTEARIDWFPHFPPSDEDDCEFFKEANNKQNGPTGGRSFSKLAKA